MVRARFAARAPVDANYVSVQDTDMDMLCHAGGSILFCLHYLIHVFTKKNLGMGAFIKDIEGTEMNVGG